MISVVNDLEKHIEKTYGKRGTLKRDKFEKELDKIYLQKEEGTWCEDRINDDDVEYMRVEQDDNNWEKDFDTKFEPIYTVNESMGNKYGRAQSEWFNHDVYLEDIKQFIRDLLARKEQEQ